MRRGPSRREFGRKKNCARYEKQRKEESRRRRKKEENEQHEEEKSGELQEVPVR